MEIPSNTSDTVSCRSIGRERIKSMASHERKISFPADSIINAVIQDGDIHELLSILRHQRSEIDLNQTNHVGLTALHHAVLANNLDSVKILLNNGANVHVQDVHGFSPLHTAAALGFLQITSFLVLFGADVFSLTKQSELPVDVAKDLSVIRLLTNEMCVKLHQEIYLSSYMWRKTKQCLLVFSGLLYLILRTFVLLSVKVTNHLKSRLGKIDMMNRKCNAAGSTTRTVSEKNDATCGNNEPIKNIGMRKVNIKSE